MLQISFSQFTLEKALTRWRRHIAIHGYAANASGRLTQRTDLAGAFFISKLLTRLIEIAYYFFSKNNERNRANFHGRAIVYRFSVRIFGFVCSSSAGACVRRASSPLTTFLRFTRVFILHSFNLRIQLVHKLNNTLLRRAYTVFPEFNARDPCSISHFSGSSSIVFFYRLEAIFSLSVFTGSVREA